MTISLKEVNDYGVTKGMTGITFYCLKSLKDAILAVGGAYPQATLSLAELLAACDSIPQGPTMYGAYAIITPEASTADINTAIQTLIDTYGGGVVGFTEGLFLLDEPLVVRGSNIAFIGCGSETIIKCGADMQYIIRKVYPYDILPIADRNSTNGEYGGIIDVRAKDPYTTTLLHLTGADNGVVFTEELGKTPTVNGNVCTKLITTPVGTSALYLDGSSWIDFPACDDFNFGSGDFTIEKVFKRSRTGVFEYLCGQQSSSGNGNSDFSIGIYFTADNRINVQIGYGTSVKSLYSTNTLTDTISFHHLVYTRNGNNHYILMDGVVWASNTDLSGITINNSTKKFAIGRGGEYTDYYFQGYVAEFRISKGIARYATAFTPPTTPFAVERADNIAVRNLVIDGGAIEFGKAQAGTTTSITLASTASSVDDYYNGTTVLITEGTNAGQTKTITAYNGTTKEATVATWLAPDSTSVYSITFTDKKSYGIYAKNCGKGFTTGLTTGTARYDVSTVGINNVGKVGISIEDCVVGGCSGYGIYSTYSCNSIISGNIVQNSNYGIAVGISKNNVISNNIIQNNINHGIYLITVDCNDSILNNTVQNNGGYGIYLMQASNNIVSGNTIQNNNSYGIYLQSSNNNTISGNTSQNNNVYGIYLNSANNNTVSSNTVQNNGNYGIDLSASDNNTISGNTVQNNGNSGIMIGSSSSNIISGNIVYTNNGYGIKLNDSVCTSNLILSNELNSNTSGAYSDSGTSTKKTNNYPA